MFVSCCFMSAGERKSPTDNEGQKDLSYSKKGLWRIFVLDVSSQRSHIVKWTKVEPLKSGSWAYPAWKVEACRKPGVWFLRSSSISYPPSGTSVITLSVWLYSLSGDDPGSSPRVFQARMKHGQATKRKEWNGAGSASRIHIGKPGLFCHRGGNSDSWMESWLGCWKTHGWEGEILRTLVSPDLTLLMMQTLWRAPWLYGLSAFSHATNILKYFNWDWAKPIHTHYRRLCLGIGLCHWMTQRGKLHFFFSVCLFLSEWFILNKFLAQSLFLQPWERFQHLFLMGCDSSWRIFSSSSKSLCHSTLGSYLEKYLSTILDV